MQTYNLSYKTWNYGTLYN